MSSQADKDKLTRDYEDKQTSYYDCNYKNETRGNYLRRLRNELINRAAESAVSCEKVLDAGCGPAILYEDLLRRSDRYYALDMVQSNLDEIRKCNAGTDNIEYVLSDVDNLEWEPDYFDVIICSGSIEYHQYPERNLEKFLQMLKPGGTLICSFPNIMAPYRIWGEYVYKYLWYARNRLLGRSAFIYPRKLFSAGRVENICSGEPAVNSIETRYFGWRVILQPLDSIFRSLDYRLTRGYEDNRRQYMQAFCTEFLLIVHKQVDSPAPVASDGARP